MHACTFCKLLPVPLDPCSLPILPVEFGSPFKIPGYTPASYRYMNPVYESMHAYMANNSNGKPRTHHTMLTSYLALK